MIREISEVNVMPDIKKPQNDVHVHEKKYFPGKGGKDFIVDPPMEQEMLTNKVLNANA